MTVLFRVQQANPVQKTGRMGSEHFMPRVAMVVDPWHHPFNGTVVSTRRFIAALSARFKFHILVTEEPGQTLDEGCVGFPRMSIPGINPIIDRMKAPLARPHRQRLERVIADSDLLHVQFPFFLGHGAITEARRQGKPVVASFHVQPENILSNLNLTSQWLTAVMYRFFVWRFYSRADCVIAPSQFAADLLIKAGLQVPVTVLSNGVTREFFVDRAAAKKGPPFHVVSVGRLAAEKQQHHLIDAIAGSRFKQDIQLSLVGTGPQQKRLEEQARRRGVQATIGRVTDEALGRLYQTADLFVQTSAVELEGMSVLEAMAAGCPVLINKASTSAVPEFVTAAEATYSMNSVPELTRKLDLLLGSEQLRDAAGSANRQIALTRDHERSVQMLSDVYDRVLNRSVCSDDEYAVQS